MAVIKKTLFPKNLDNYSVLVNDTDVNSKYFKITNLPDTFTGGKNAFLIAGSQYLVPDTKIQIELKDASGNIIYHEPGEGLISSSFNGESFVSEYFEGVSKVVSVYVYPDTSYGPCTLTILGELSSYESDGGITSIVPLDWENKYNVKWQRQINVDPSLANTTKIRFYQRPQATITEILNPIYTIVSGSKVASAVTQSFADIKLSKLETFAGDVKRIRVFRTSEGDISDYDLIQDILVESKELLTSYGLTGSVVGNTGTFTSETIKNYWNSGSLNAVLNSERIAAGVRLTGSGNFTYTSSLDIKSANTYELNLDAFYSSSTASNLEIYLKSGSASSSIGKLYGIAPTKNLSDTVIPFKIDKDYISASLYFSQSHGDWHLGNISLKLSQDTAFSPDEISFVTTMPTAINNQTYNFKFEFYDVNNNYVPVAVTQSATFTGGNSGATAKLLTFQTDRSAFRFSTGSYGNPANQTVKFSTQKTNLTGSLTYASSAFDIGGNYITPASYAGTYPGTLTNVSDNGALLTIANFSGSVASVLVGSIVYTASCENFIEYETIYRFEDGDNAPGVFVTANTNQFIYKATDLSLNPSGQVITIEAKRKNLASAVTPLTINSGSGKPGLTFVSTNSTNGVDTYTIAGTSYPHSTGETTYYVSGSDQFGNVFSDAIKISPVKILDGFSVAVSNENTSFPALSIGTVVGGFAASSGSITVKVGNEAINYSSTFVTNSFSASISAYSGLTPNTFNGTNYSINTLSADSGSLSLLIKYKDGGGTIISSSKDITYSKAKIGTPNIVVAVSPTSQTLVANSKGSGSATPAALSVTALEGSTSRFASIGTPTYTGGLAGSVSTNTITFSSNASTMYSDSGSVTIPVNYTDSEGTTGTKNIVANISKAKSAAPTTLALLSSETQTILSSSAGFATPSTFTITVNEGGSNYSYDASLASNSTYYVSSITGGSNSSGTITPTTPTTTTGTTVSLTISYKNSEGTTGTITKTHKVAVSLEGTKGTDGTPGSPGSDGKRTATGMIFYQPSAASAPSTPTATTYTFSTNAFASLTANWAVGAPTYTAGNTNKYWYSTYTAVETTAGGGTAVPTFSTPVQAINFTGLVTFTSADNITDGTNSSNIVTPGAVTNNIGGAGVTTINGGKVSTGIITSTGYTLTGSDTLASGSYTGGGTIFNLDNGSLRSKNFYISSAGDAFFKGGGTFSGDLSAAGGTFSGNLSAAGGTFSGNLSAAGGTFSGNLSAAGGTFSGNLSAAGGTFSGTLSAVGGTFTGALSGGTISIGSANAIFKADSNGIYLGNATFASAPFRVSMEGALTTSAVTITGGTITIGSKFNVGSDGTISASGGTFSGAITAGNGSSIGGWTISNSSIYVNNGITMDAVAKKITIFDTLGTARVYFSTNSALSDLITGGSSGGGTKASTNLNTITGTGIEYVTTVASGITTTSGLITNITINCQNNVGTQGFRISASSSTVVYFAQQRFRIYVVNDSTSAETDIVSYASNTNAGNTTLAPNFDSFVDASDGTLAITGDGSTYTLKVATTVIYGTGGSVNVTANTPEFTWAYSIPVGATEIVPGGMQVVYSSGRYLKVPRTSAGTFVDIKGGFTADSKAFRITHPLDETKWLYHSSIEGPRIDNLYRGYIQLNNGTATINLDQISNMMSGTWSKLNRDPQFFLQNMTGWDKVRGNILGNILSIECENTESLDTISYMVIGERQDEDVKDTWMTDSDGKLVVERNKIDS